MTFDLSKNASISSSIRNTDLEVIAIEYCKAKLAIDFYPPDSWSRSYTNLLVGGVGK